MDVSAYKRKIKQLFDTILKDDIEISAYHSENIIKHLDSSRDKCTEKILETPLFAELIIYALKNYNSATTSVKVFIVKIVTIVLRNEVHFNRFLQMQGFELLVSKCKEESRALPAALHAAYVEQAAALTAHYSGLKYVVDWELYRQVLSPVTHQRPPALAATMYDFMTKLIWKLNEYDEEAALLETLQFVVQPIMTIDCQSALSLGVDRDKVISDQLVTYLHTLVAVLGEIDHLIVPNKVVPILTSFGVVESKLAAILEESRDTALAGLLAELSLRYQFAAGRQAALLDPAAEGRVNEELNVSYYKIIDILVKKRCIYTVLDFNCKCHIYLYKVEAVGPPVSFERFGRRFELRNQFLIMLLVPLFAKSKAKRRLVDDHELEEAFETFTYDVAKDISHDIVKSAYGMRELITETGTEAACVHVVRQVLKLPRLLSRRQAGVVFQVLYYALSEYVLSDGAGALVLEQNPLRSPEDEQLVGCALDAVKMLLEEHDITWYESVEIMNLQAALINLIKQNILPIKLLVQVLDLVTLSVRKLLSPELALLLQSARGGSLGEAGGAAGALLARPEWRVRVAALALIHSFTEIAFVKFAALRAVIAQHALLAGAARAALGDPAPPAQAAALRCLAAAARCECLWLDLLVNHHDLYEQLVSIVRHNADGEVRKEAINVLTDVYVNHRVTRAFTSRVARVMTRAALRDPSAGARVAALRYWRALTRNICYDAGMIDGSFPTVTFSKEKRKIITLTEQEIHKQLQTILGNCSTTGVLAVILKCMSPNNSVEVIENAYKICRVMMSMLDHYNFGIGDASAQSGSSERESADPEPGRPATPAGDALIPDHTDIFSEIYNTNCSWDEELTPVEVIDPSRFLKIYKSMDYEAIIKSKKKASDAADLDTLIEEVISLGSDQCSKPTELEV